MNIAFTSDVNLSEKYVFRNKYESSPKCKFWFARKILQNTIIWKDLILLWVLVTHIVILQQKTQCCFHTLDFVVRYKLLVYPRCSLFPELHVFRDDSMHRRSFLRLFAAISGRGQRGSLRMLKRWLTTVTNWLHSRVADIYDTRIYIFTLWQVLQFRRFFFSLKSSWNISVSFVINIPGTYVLLLYTCHGRLNFWMTHVFIYQPRFSRSIHLCCKSNVCKKKD